MSQYKVDLDLLVEKIAELESLNETFLDSKDKLNINKEQAGKTNAQIKELISNAKEAHKLIEELIDNTISYFTMIKNNVESSDKKGVQSIRKDIN